MIYEHYFMENGDNIPVKQQKTDDDNNPLGIYVNHQESIQDEEHYFDLTMDENQGQTWDSLDCITQQHLPPVIQLDDSLGNLSASPVDPMGNMSTSSSGPIKTLSSSPSDFIGNDNSILHELNLSPYLDPIDGSFSQFPIMAEKRNYDDTSGESENCIQAKHQKTDVHTGPFCTSVNNQDLSEDEDGRLDSGNNEDPLSDLTQDQRVVLYTLYLCMENWGEIVIDDNVSMGYIDVWKIVKELENKGLVEPNNRDIDHRKEIPCDKQCTIIKSYREKCLLNDIDKDFFIQIASHSAIGTYANVYCHHIDGSRKSEDKGPITAMRLIVEGLGHHLPCSLKEELPAFLLRNEKELGMFIKFWCKARNTDSVTLWDQIPDEKVTNFYSAFTFLSGLKNKLMEMNFSKKKWSMLISTFMSESYSVCVNIPWKEKIKIIQKSFISLQEVNKGRTEEDLVLLEELEHQDKVLTVDRENNKVSFVSEEIRHQVMGYFVLNCLESKEDYEHYLNLSSVDSLFENARALTYERRETERCIYLPIGTEKLFVRRLGIDAIQHTSVGNTTVAYEISSQLNIPTEVLDWDSEARRRYTECLKKGTLMVHRARTMIVGCAGAGKTTLLNRLQHRSIWELKQIESTVGLEVHENIFEIVNKSLKALSDEQTYENKCLLSVVDFAGHCAYYACHQVYLSRRAFYLLVIDLSKPFDGKVDRELYEQEGTMFSDWTYGQYIIFWLKSTHTYCDDDTPVITIGTHCDKIQNVDESIYDDLLELLKDEPELKMHIDSSRCFRVGLPLNDSEPIDKLTDIEACIASIALEDRWKETIPGDWASCEAAFRENKRRGKKMISLSNFKKQVSIKMSKKDEETFDMLRFYNDTGSILHFNEEDLKNKTIIDVQWFVDCFKNIITDPKHARKVAKDDTHWQFYNKSGYLSEELLHQIWKKTKMDLRKCKPTLKYMQRLGLVAVGKEFHYIPCMNKLDFGDDLKKYISSLSQKSSVLIFKFEFLPHFFYFRLVVACMVDAHWTVVEDAGQKYVFKNAVCFTFQEHFIVLVVTMTTIQIQIFRQEDVLSCEVTKKIRDTVIENLKRLTKNFHKKAIYLKGYQCSRQSVLEELTSDFLLEDEILGKRQITCPRHGGKSHHFVSERELLLYWTDEKQEEITEAKIIQGMQEHRKEHFSASKFRKPKDNSLHSMELKTFFTRDWQDSVGHLFYSELTGTAFRVGDRYLLTAFHIIEGILDACLKMIIENAQRDPNRGNNCQYLLQELDVEVTGSGVEEMIENGIKTWMTKCKENLWLSSLLEVLRVSGFSFARENILKNINEKHMQVVFGRLKEDEEGIKFPVKFDIPFSSKTEDIAILEIDSTNLHRVPTAFALERSTIIAPDSVHIVGYPASHGRKQIFDPKCPLISEMDARTTLEQWRVKFPGENFENFSRACDSAFSGKEKVLFHCSESTAHGASGSPGLILSDTDKPKVYLMLQEGFPSFVYGNNCQIDIKTVPKEYLIESGISMSRVYSLLSTTPYLVNLRNAIFHF